jgi:uncharacterized protein YciI
MKLFRTARSTEFATVVLALMFSSVLAAQTLSQAPANPNLPKGMKQYFIGFLTENGSANQSLSREQFDELKQKHLAFIRTQVQAGKILLAGPLLDDGPIRGFAIINAASVSDAREITEDDPLVKSGMMEMGIHPAMLADVSCVKMEYPAAHTN